MGFSERRRQLLGAIPAFVGGVVLATLSNSSHAKEIVWEENPFSLGVASGFPSDQSVVLWTKLHPRSQLPNQAIEIVWQIALDQYFDKLVREGTFVTQPDENHTAHVEVAGLRSNTQFFYRFISGAHKSVLGVTRTLPAPYSVEKHFSFALASCQNYEHGFFTAYDQMSDMKPDLVVFVGNYIHQSITSIENKVRKHFGFDECNTLFEYRQRYAQYRTDPSLQKIHQQLPWLVIWDDQEVSVGYSGYRDLKKSLVFHKRREAAYQAFWEFMPMPYRLKPKKGGVEYYQAIVWGRLASFTLLDTRQYRDPPVCFDQKKENRTFGTKKECGGFSDNESSILGLKQEGWLQNQLSEIRARWNFIVQPSSIASMGQPFDQYFSDGWDGYPNARERLYKSLQTHKPSNPVVLSGGLRTAQLSELRYQSSNTNQNVETVGLEFSTPSITSSGWSETRTQQVADANPHIRYVSSRRRGFLFFDVTHDSLSVSLYGVEDVTQPSSPSYLIDRFEVKSKELKINRLRRVGA